MPVLRRRVRVFRWLALGRNRAGLPRLTVARWAYWRPVAEHPRYPGSYLVERRR